MKKNVKVLLILTITLMLLICLCCCGREDDYYEAYEINSISITQKSTNTFDFVVDADISPTSTAKVYITKYDNIPDSAQYIDYTANDNNYVFTATVSYDHYYVWVVDGNKTSVLPMTRPQMAPSLRSTTEGTNNVITYNFVNGTSWSSFCDPTGKAVYKSSSSVYDSSAKVVATNVSISGVDSTTDVSPSDAEPYYYVVLTAKNGIVKYVSAPIVTYERAFSNVQVTLIEESGKPYLQVTGVFLTAGDVAVELYSADTKLGKVTEMIGERAEGNANDSFTVKIDATQIVADGKGEGIWFDIKLAASSGALYELPDSVADTSQTVREGFNVFSFKTWNNILKLTFEYFPYEVTSTKIEVVEGVPTLIVEGSYAQTVNNIKLHADYETDSKKNLYWNNAATQDGQFLFKVALTDLPSVPQQPWCWFHIYVYEGNATVPSSSNDLLRGAQLTIGERFSYEGVDYVIQAWNNVGEGLAIQPMPTQE